MLKEKFVNFNHIFVVSDPFLKLQFQSDITMVKNCGRLGKNSEKNCGKLRKIVQNCGKIAGRNSPPSLWQGQPHEFSVRDFFFSDNQASFLPIRGGLYPGTFCPPPHKPKKNYPP